MGQVLAAYRSSVNHTSQVPEEPVVASDGAVIVGKLVDGSNVSSVCISVVGALLDGPVVTGDGSSAGTSVKGAVVGRNGLVV